MPRMEEKAYMHFRDMDFENSIKLYKKLWESGDRSHNVVTQLTQLYLQYGEVGKAIEIMEAYIADHPDSYEALEKIATLYQYNQQSEKYLQTLENLYKKRPAEEKLRDLSKLYNYYGQIDKQIATLEELIVAFSPQSQDYVDLAYLYGSRGDALKAQEILKKRLALANTPPSQELIELYVNLLLDTNNRTEAVNIIHTYNQDPAFAAELALLLESRGADQEAQQVLVPYLKKPLPHPKILLALTEIEVNKEQAQHAFDRLVALYREDQLPSTLVDTTMSLALRMNDHALVSDILEHADLRELSEETLLIMIEYSLQTGNPAIVKTIQKRLDSTFLNLYPIARDVIQLVSTANIPSTILTNLGADDTALSERALEALIGIYQRTGHKNAALKLLDRFVKEKNGGGDPLRIADFYLRLAKPQEGYAAFDALRKRLPPSPVLSHAWALLAVASGNTAAVSRLIQETQTPSPTMLTDIYYVARDYGHASLALEAAQKLYAIKQQPKSRSLLASALVANGSYEEALEHLRALAPTGEYEASDYITAVAGAAKTSKGTLSGPLKADLRLLLDGALSRHPLTPIEMRDFAFLFYENGLHETGDDFFTRLAANPKAQDINLEGLAAFWSKRNARTHIPWLWQRVRTSDGKRLALWLTLLLRAGETSDVARYIQSLPPEKTASEEYKNMYYHALLQTKKVKTLEPQLAFDIVEEQGIRRLADLADIAEEAELPSLAKQALSRIAIYLPENSYVARKLGYIEYNLGEYDKARQHILASLADGPGDYLSHYLAGELLFRAEEKREAQSHYVQALILLDRLPPKTTDQHSLRAELLLRVGRDEEALALYRTLYTKEPENKELKADFANALIRLERYREAEHLLEIDKKRRNTVEEIGKTMHDTYGDARKRIKRLWQENR